MALPPRMSPSECVSTAHHTVPATPPTISKSFAASTSFAGSATLAATHRSPAGSARSPRSSYSATRPSNPCSPLPCHFAPLAAPTTPNPSMPTTTLSSLPCTASSTNSASPLDDRQDFCRASPRSAYDILFRTAAETLLTIAGDPEHLGADLGFFAVLHTWGQTLLHHPHLHCVVAGGGLSPDGSRWVACRPNFFLPVCVLARLFRRLFLVSLEKAF